MPLVLILVLILLLVFLFPTTSQQVDEILCISSHRELSLCLFGYTTNSSKYDRGDLNDCLYHSTEVRIIDFILRETSASTTTNANGEQEQTCSEYHINFYEDLMDLTATPTVAPSSLAPTIANASSAYPVSTPVPLKWTACSDAMDHCSLQYEDLKTCFNAAEDQDSLVETVLARDRKCGSDIARGKDKNDCTRLALRPRSVCLLDVAPGDCFDCVYEDWFLVVRDSCTAVRDIAMHYITNLCDDCNPCHDYIYMDWQCTGCHQSCIEDRNEDIPDAEPDLREAWDTLADNNTYVFRNPHFTPVDAISSLQGCRFAFLNYDYYNNTATHVRSSMVQLFEPISNTNPSSTSTTTTTTIQLENSRMEFFLAEKFRKAYSKFVDSYEWRGSFALPLDATAVVIGASILMNDSIPVTDILSSEVVAVLGENAYPTSTSTTAIMNTNDGGLVVTSNDGDTLVVASRKEVKVFFRKETNSNGSIIHQYDHTPLSFRRDPFDRNQDDFVVALSGDGHTLAVGSATALTSFGSRDQGVVKVFRSERMERFEQVSELKGPIAGSLSLSHDGKVLATGSHSTNNEGSVQVYSLLRQDGTTERYVEPIGQNLAPPGLPHDGYSVSLTPGGNTVAVGGYLPIDCYQGGVDTSRVFRLNKNETSQVWEEFGPPGGIEMIGSTVSLAPDEGLLATLTKDGTMRVYAMDSRCGAEIPVTPGPTVPATTRPSDNDNISSRPSEAPGGNTGMVTGTPGGNTGMVDESQSPSTMPRVLEPSSSPSSSALTKKDTQSPTEEEAERAVGLRSGASPVLLAGPLLVCLSCLLTMLC